MNRRLLTCGEHAVLVELDGLEDVLALNAAVLEAVEAGDTAFADVIDVVPAARTLLLVIREGADLTPVRTGLPTLSLPNQPLPNASSPNQSVPAESPAPSTSTRPGPPASPRDGFHGEPPVVEILVTYDGPDLDEVAELTGMSRTEVVAAHTRTPWRAAFSGFAPGFAYLVGGDPRLRVPRRSEPRTSVAAGSVGLAGEFSAVYPRSSPGGWQLLGHTDAVLWDLERQPPALLKPGSVVQFVNADTDGAAGSP